MLLKVRIVISFFFLFLKSFIKTFALNRINIIIKYQEHYDRRIVKYRKFIFSVKLLIIYNLYISTSNARKEFGLLISKKKLIMQKNVNFMKISLRYLLIFVLYLSWIIQLFFCLITRPVFSDPTSLYFIY